MFGFKRKKIRYEYEPVDSATRLLELPPKGLVPRSVCVNSHNDTYYAFLEEDADGTVKVVWYKQNKVEHYG